VPNEALPYGKALELTSLVSCQTGPLEH